MNRLPKTRKKFILKIFVVLVVCAFLSTSLVPLVEHSGTSANTKSIDDAFSTPLISSNNTSSNAGYVKCTLVLTNNTLIKGNFLSANGIKPIQAAFDSSNGYVYVTNEGSNTVSVINGTTNTVIETLSVGFFPQGISFNPSNGFVYVTVGCNVLVINGATNTIVKSIAIGCSYPYPHPYGVTFDSSNGYLYVADTTSNNVSVINCATNFVIKNITVGSHPICVAFDSSNGYVYVANCCSDTVSVINGATNAVIKNVTVCSNPHSFPYGVTFDSSNGYVYVMNSGSDTVSVINGANNSVIKNITVGSSPIGAAFDSSNGYVYAANKYSNSVSVINGATNTVIKTVSLCFSPRGIGFDPSNGFVYVTVGSNVLVINSAINSVVNAVSIGIQGTRSFLRPYGVTFDSSNGYVYVTNEGSNTVSVINGATNSVIKNITVGSRPNEAAFDSSNGYVYVANCFSDTVSVINGANNSVVKNITVGSGPNGVTFDSSNGYVYVANYFSNNVTIINSAIDTVVDTVSVGTKPYGVALDSSNGYLYVTNCGSGSISILSPTNQTISEYNYSVIFTELGLPSGTSWSVTLNGATESSTTNTVEFSLANGTYSYTIGAISGYSASSLSGAVKVDGANVNIQITFTSTETTQNKYTVLFTATGIPQGSSWSILLNKSMKSSTSSSIEFNETNGTYSYVVYPPIHMSATPDSGTVNVSGASVVVSVSINYQNWQSSQAFNISNSSITLGSVGGFVFNENVNSYPIKVYSIQASRGVSENEFASNLSYYLGINVNSSYSPAYVIILDIPLVKIINTEFGTSLENYIGMNLSKMLSSNLFINGALNTTNSGNLIFAFTLSYSNDVNQYANLAISSVTSLLALAGLLIADSISPIKKSPIDVILSALQNIEANILSSFDLTITDITSSLSDLGALSAHTFTDMATFFRGVSDLIKAGSILNKFVSLLYFVGDLISSIGLSAATSLLDLLSDASVISSLIQVSFTSVDITIDTIAFFNFYNIDSNWFFDSVKSAIDAATSIIDPNGSTVIPSVVEANGTIVLGYNPQTGSMIYHNSYGFMFNTSSNYVMYLNRSFAGSFSIVYYSIGNGSQTELVPYESSIMVENDSIGAAQYAGLLPTGTNVSAEFSVNNGYNISLINSVLRPSVTLTDGKGGFNIWISGVNRTSSGGSAKVYIFNKGIKEQATLESNGTYYYFKPYSYSPNSQLVDLYAVQNGTLGGYSFVVIPPQFQVTFQESGLSQGSNWYVNISGQGESGPINGTSYSVVLPDGSYSFSVYAGSKYTYNSSNSFSINGANITENLTFKKSLQPNLGSQLTNLIYSFIFIAIIIAVALAVVFRNRRKK